MDHHFSDALTVLTEPSLQVLDMLFASIAAALKKIYIYICSVNI